MRASRRGDDDNWHWKYLHSTCSANHCGSSVWHYPQENKNRIFVICLVCSFGQLMHNWILIDSSSVLSMEHLQLSAKVNLAGNIRKRRNKCRGKSLAAHVILWHPSRPTISKQEAITISSTFTARPLSSLFYSCLLSFLFCFSSTVSHFHSIFIVLLPLWALLSFPWLTIAVDASIHPPLYALMNVDLSEDCNPIVWDFICTCDYRRCASVLMFVCMFVQPHRGDLMHPDGSGGERGIQRRLCYGIMEDVSFVSLIIGLYRCLSLPHKHLLLVSFLSHKHTHSHIHLYPLPSLPLWEASLNTLSA